MEAKPSECSASAQIREDRNVQIIILLRNLSGRKRFFTGVLNAAGIKLERVMDLLLFYSDQAPQ